MESLSGTLELAREKRTKARRDHPTQSVRLYREATIGRLPRPAGSSFQERADETSQSLFRISLIFSL